jgi:hypothetical protein
MVKYRVSGIFLTMVSVTFVDAQSGDLIGRGEMPSAQLPETVAIADSFYMVERAQIQNDGEVTAFLRPILYSLPTICDRVPKPDPVLVSTVSFDMHEDDWRQIEFVDASLAPVVEEQRRLIRDVVDNHSRRDTDGHPIGFDKLHLRTEPADPLPHGITIRRLVEVIDADTAYGGVAFPGRPYVVSRSFAFGTGSLVCYGLAEGGLVKVLGLNRMPDPGIDLTFEGTILVNWLA